MSPELQNTLLKKVLGPAFVILVVLVVTRLRGQRWKEDITITALPRASSLALWVVLWLLWMALTEAAIDWFGLADPDLWKPYPPLIIALRILAIGVLGPIAEELVFRGVLYFRLSRTPLRPAGTIVLLAAVWAVLHVQYDWPTVGVIFVDGLVLGVARWHSGTVLVPCLLHVLGNLYSIYQSLGG